MIASTALIEIGAGTYFVVLVLRVLPMGSCYAA